MLFMSCWDVASSCAIALATVPMPADVREIYPFPGGSFGNVLTCTCQGLIIVVGSMYAIWSNCTLNVYYVCTIKYGMSEETVNRRVLPVMLGISTVYVCFMNGMGLSLGLFNPRPYEPFCLAGPYPHNCLEEDDVECIRGGDLSHSMMMFLRITVLVTGLLSLICILTSMVLVIVTVFRTELAWREYGPTSTTANETARSEIDIDINTNTTGDNSSTSSRTAHFTNTRIALRQALMYIAAFTLTWVWLGIALIVGENVWNDPLKLFFQPLQGFFNAAIFFVSKVEVVRRSSTRFTRCQAFRQVIVSPWTVPEIIVSHIEVLDNDDDNDSSLNSLHHWNVNIQRTGRLRSGMDLSPVLSVVPSNDTPSFHLSRAMSSENIVEMTSRNAGGNANPGPDIETNETKLASDGNDDDAREDNDASTSHPRAASSPEPHPPRRMFYQWPPPESSSSSVGSISSIWNFRSIMGGRGAGPASGSATGTGTCANVSKPKEEEEGSAVEGVNVHNGCSQRGSSLALSQDVSSSLYSVGTSVICSAIVGSRSSDLSDLAEELCEDDD